MGKRQAEVKVIEININPRSEDVIPVLKEIRQNIEGIKGTVKVLYSFKKGRLFFTVPFEMYDLALKLLQEKIPGVEISKSNRERDAICSLS
ncbi:MAG: hypothetical protein PHX30_04880 [Candidatus Pacebacteria bacterium]|jgi:hypothetical protein|nr:hypothetical protein [Candidatus Paceibacterota bacterium]